LLKRQRERELTAERVTVGPNMTKTAKRDVTQDLAIFSNVVLLTRPRRGFFKSCKI